MMGLLGRMRIWGHLGVSRLIDWEASFSSPNRFAGERGMFWRTGKGLLEGDGGSVTAMDRADWMMRMRMVRKKRR